MTNRILTTPAGSMLLKSKLWRGLGKSHTWILICATILMTETIKQIHYNWKHCSSRDQLSYHWLQFHSKLEMMLSLSSKQQRSTRKLWRSSYDIILRTPKNKSKLLAMTKSKKSENSECEIITGRCVLLILGKGSGKVTMIHKSPVILPYQMSWEGNLG